MDIAPFLSYLENVKRYSPHTLLAYKEDLGQFLDYCATINEVSDFPDVTSKMVREWMVIEMSKGRKATTTRRKLSVLRTLFKYDARRNTERAHSEYPE